MNISNEVLFFLLLVSALLGGTFWLGVKIYRSRVMGALALEFFIYWDRFKDWFWDRLRIKRPVALPLRAFDALSPDFKAKEKLYSWEDWHNDAKKDHPVRYFFTETLRRWWNRHIAGNISHALYWLRTHTIDKYHLVDMRNPDYKWGWVDRSEAILYASFALLKDFYENEFAPPEGSVVDWGYDEEHQRISSEIVVLYDWWVRGRAKEHAAHDAAAEACKTTDELLALPDMDERDQEMLLRLIAIRGCLWT